MTLLYIEFKLKPTSDSLDLYILYAEYKLFRVKENVGSSLLKLDCEAKEKPQNP